MLLMCSNLLFISCLNQNTSMDKIEEKRVQENISLSEAQEFLYPTEKIVGALNEQTWSIFQDQKGNYWFGSNGDGVIFYDGDSLRRFTERDGLVNNTIRGIQEDHLGNIFIETPHGVSKYDGKKFTTLTPTISPINQWKLLPNDLWFNCN